MVAIDIRESGTIGCSYYSAQEETLYLLEDMQSAGIEILDSRLLSNSFHRFKDTNQPLVVIQAKPTVLLLSPRVDYLGPQDTEESGQGNSKLPWCLVDKNWRLINGR